MQDNQEKCKELAIRIYNLDEEVYKCVGSSLGRTFTGQKETTLSMPNSASCRISPRATLSFTGTTTP